MTTSAPEQSAEPKLVPLSRLGRKPVEIPQGVTVAVSGSTVNVEGKRGKLSWTLPNLITAKVDGNVIKIEPTLRSTQSKALHGLSRKLVLNMVEGVTKGF